MSNRKIDVQITPYCNTYVTIIMRIMHPTDDEKALIMENAKKCFEKAIEYQGKSYDIPVYTPIEIGEIVFNNTFAFPNEEALQRYLETVFNIFE